MKGCFFRSLFYLLAVFVAGCTNKTSVTMVHCGCGNQDDGIYSWEVPQEEGCCSKKAVNGFLETFKAGEQPGVWEPLSKIEIDVKEIQRIYCRKS